MFEFVIRRQRPLPGLEVLGIRALAMPVMPGNETLISIEKKRAPGKGNLDMASAHRRA
jgi:hypothetical protein